MAQFFSFLLTKIVCQLFMFLIIINFSIRENIFKQTILVDFAFLVFQLKKKSVYLYTLWGIEENNGGNLLRRLSLSQIIGHCPIRKFFCVLPKSHFPHIGNYTLYLDVGDWEYSFPAADPSLEPVSVNPPGQAQTFPWKSVQK